MRSPVFEEFDSAGDRGCPGCEHWRRVLPHSRTGGFPGHPAARRTALVLAAVASTAIGAPAAPALAAPPVRHLAGPDVSAGEDPDTPQGTRAPLFGAGGRPALPVRPPAPVRAPPITRAEIIERARSWVTKKVPYGFSSYWSDGYRQDCSGYVSMAWNLPGNEWTGSLAAYGRKISKSELRPGDMLLFHNAANPYSGSHVVLFGGWKNAARTQYVAYEQTRPHTRRKTTPYAYWSNSSRYVPYRYKGVTDGAAGAAAAAGSLVLPPRTPFPGVACFGPGAENAYVAELGRMLVRRGAAPFYDEPPGPRWTEEDRRATQAFQEAQGWRGAAADGLPGPSTWELLVTGEGQDIQTGASASGTSAPPPAPSSHGVPGYPGRAPFRPGAENVHVTRLGRQLVKKGFGRHCTDGPGPRWGERDRRNVEAFQRSQGWRGGAADGVPGPETWRRLFS